MALRDTMPIYVTRPTAVNGETGSLYISIWMVLVPLLLVWVNVIVWSTIGLIQAAKYFF